MSQFKTSLIAALLSIVATAGGLYYFQQGRLRESRQLQKRNDQMRAEANRRHSATMAAPHPPVSAPAVTTGNATPMNLAAAIQPQPLAEYYRNEGNATPLAALQTFAWACDRGDTDEVGRLLHIDAGARLKAEAFMASLSEEARIQWKNVDETAAAVLTRAMMGQPFPNADILESATVELIGTDRVRLRLPDVPKDGTEYQKTDDGWKYVLTEEVVDNYVRRMEEQSARTAR